MNQSTHESVLKSAWSTLSEITCTWDSQHQAFHCINPFQLNHIICWCKHSSDLLCWCCSTCHHVVKLPKYKYFCWNAMNTWIDINSENLRNRSHAEELQCGNSHPSYVLLFASPDTLKNKQHKSIILPFNKINICCVYRWDLINPEW